jgi:ERCC4-related helicase
MNDYVHPIQQIYYAWDLTHKKSSYDEGKFTGVLSEAKVDMNPHQVEAALFAFKSPLSKGAILADEVGLGKTIEAGIILSELWAEHKRRIIIVVPASLRNQWSIELMEKFYLPSTILETDCYRDMNARNENPFDGEHGIIVCSYNFATRHSVELEEVHWDLVVFDEAHKMRNVYKKDNVVGRVMMDTFKQYKKILLTATPLQNNLKELYGLISIIDPHFFSSVNSFEEQYNAVSTRDASKYGELKGRLSHIVNRTLRSQVKEYVKYTKRTAFVQEYEASINEMKLYEHVSDYLQRNGTYGIPDKVKPMLSLIVRKIMSSSAYALSYTLEGFIQRLETYKETGKMPSAMSSVKKDYEVWQDDEGDVVEDLVRIVNPDIIDKEIKELRVYQNEAMSIKDETKAQNLLIALEKTFETNEKLGAPRKALIFTESRRTQAYLKSYLEKHGYSGKVVCFNGINDDEPSKTIYNQWRSIYAGTDRVSGSSVIDRKQALVDYFRNEAEIMIATESGAEGINLQFCSLLINYDMPWNPQRIEQRIGRCHRYGQKFDVIVVNFVNKLNYADRRVYELLNAKFNLFDGVFGCSDEVLGSVESAIDIEKRLNKIFQTCRTEREIAAAFDQLQIEMDDVIKQRIKDTKKALLENFDEEVVGKLKVRQGDDLVRVDSYNLHLWKLAKSLLSRRITQVNDEAFSFVLCDSPSPEIPSGQYVVNKECRSAHQLRVGSPLGEYVLKCTTDLVANDSDIIFNLDHQGCRQMMLEQYKGRSGGAIVYKVRVYNKYDEHEHLICCARVDDGDILPVEFTEKLLDVDVLSASSSNMGKCIEDALSDEFEVQLNKLKLKVCNQTEEFVSYEIDKYQAWAEDQVYVLENEVIALRHEDDVLKRQIRKERNAGTKLKLQEEESRKARTLRQKQRELYDKQDENSEKVDEMTRKLRYAMDNHFEPEVMFRFRWSIQ